MNPALLKKAISCLAISDVYLSETHALVQKGFDPKQAGQSLAAQSRFAPERIEGLDAELTTEQETKKVKLVRIYLNAGLRFITAGLSEEIQKNPVELEKHVKAEIAASFVAEYQLKCDDLEQDAIEEFAKVNAGFNVWPYWREYVQNTCSRMHLPIAILPLYQVPKEAVAEASSEAQASSNS